jgi:hypothetical protein
MQLKLSTYPRMVCLKIRVTLVIGFWNTEFLVSLRKIHIRRNKLVFDNRTSIEKIPIISLISYESADFIRDKWVAESCDVISDESLQTSVQVGTVAHAKCDGKMHHIVPLVTTTRHRTSQLCAVCVASRRGGGGCSCNRRCYSSVSCVISHIQFIYKSTPTERNLRNSRPRPNTRDILK